MSLGVLEVLSDGDWLPVCYDMVTDEHVEVACRQLGYRQSGEWYPQDIPPEYKGGMLDL